MGFKRNIKREEIIYTYWRDGYTIDEISALTGIPRSSVGYYVRKFNRKYGKKLRKVRASRPPAFEGLEMKTEGKDKKELINSVILKKLAHFYLLKAVVKALKEGRYQDLYYALSSLKLFNELSKYYTLTPEEEKVEEEAIAEFIKNFPKYYSILAN